MGNIPLSQELNYSCLFKGPNLFLLEPFLPDVLPFLTDGCRVESPTRERVVCVDGVMRKLRSSSSIRLMYLNTNVNRCLLFSFIRLFLWAFKFVRFPNEKSILFFSFRSFRSLVTYKSGSTEIRDGKNGRRSRITISIDRCPIYRGLRGP